MADRCPIADRLEADAERLKDYGGHHGWRLLREAIAEIRSAHAGWKNAADSATILSRLLAERDATIYTLTGAMPGCLPLAVQGGAPAVIEDPKGIVASYSGDATVGLFGGGAPAEVRPYTPVCEKCGGSAACWCGQPSDRTPAEVREDVQGCGDCPWCRGEITDPPFACPFAKDERQ